MELNDHTDAPHPAVKRPSRWRQTRPAVLMVVAGLSAWGAVKAYAFFNPPNKTVAFSVPTAPQLTAREGETVYRVDPARSSATYDIEERIVGRNPSTATGRTQAIAGDIAVDLDHGDAARLGAIVVDIEQLASDEPLRDARIRNDYLESHMYQMSTLQK